MRESPEAQARSARYSAMMASMPDGDLLLTAHQADDQAETLLLNLMRGAGIDGLGGIHPYRQMGAIVVARPLLE